MTHPIFRAGSTRFGAPEAATMQRRLVEKFTRPQDVVRGLAS